MAAHKTKTNSKAPEATLRHFGLGGLGAVAIARRETFNAADDVLARFEFLKEQAGRLDNDAQLNVRGGISGERE